MGDEEGESCVVVVVGGGVVVKSSWRIDQHL
jgi:hypothetical protein